MSSDFLSATTQELGFVRWCGTSDDGTFRGACFEFGTVTNYENVCRALDGGDRFYNYYDLFEVTSRAQLDALVVEGRVTFGRYCMTVEVGSGELVRFTVEDVTL